MTALMRYTGRLGSMFSYRANPELECSVRERPSCIFLAHERLPDQRLADTSSHRLFHHYYEDMLS